MRQNIFLAALSAVTVVAAQNFTIPQGSVDPTTLNQWCSAQMDTCNTLCSNNWASNTCDTTTFGYNCKCSDGSTPDLAEYTQTMPTFICNKAYEICNTAHVGDKKGQDNCTTSIKEKCGTKQPKDFVASAPTTSSSAPSSTATGAAASASAAPSSTSSKAAGATHAATYFGNGVAAVAAGVLAAALI
ncbi:hypothetical protein B0T22DRAFT_59657 [Podospora appendiculata]|uniref:DUF7707 domain-containing protein n=1 Tax=Podospora appendiculata TaxID=314037 RepID=A0AAE0XIG5_9PEZI|nr:hypothetical protein B0T22DRAFT_59657 [Podospora appendiculata]